MWEALSLVTQVAIFSILVFGVCEYIRLQRRLAIIVAKMNCDELVDQLLADEGAPPLPPPAGTQPRDQADRPQQTSVDDTAARKRERLAALAAGGRARQYLGRAFAVEQIDAMNDDEILKLYDRYEARLGAAMTKTLGQAALQLYSLLASTFLPIPPENQPKLVADLEADPFVENALSSATCELYHRYGMYLAPVTAVLTTAKHCRFGESPRKIDSHVTDDDVIHDDRERGVCDSRDWGQHRESDRASGGADDN